MISHEHKAILIHIPKTGGSSFERLLCGQVFDHPTVSRMPNAQGFQHLDAREMKASFGREIWEEYFTFSFVRNPWDLMVSLYAFLLTEHWPGKYLYYHDVFKTGVREGIQSDGPISFEDFIDRAPTFNRYSTAGQLTYLVDRRGKIELDFIGRFENYAEDAEKILKTLGVKEKIGHDKKSEHNHYSTYYNERTKDKIYKLFRRDIKYFGYEFEKE